MTSLSSLHFQQLSFSTNIVIIIVIGAVVAYGMLFGHAKIRQLALSTYVGIVLANQLGGGLHDWLTKNNHSFDIGIVRLILFAAPVILLEFSRRHHAKGGHSGMVVGTILSVLTAGMILSMGLAQLNPDTIKHVTDNSIIAFEIYNYRLWMVAIVPFFIIAEAFVGPGHSEKKH